MKPPGSSPGISSFARTPTTNPKTIHERIAIMTSVLLVSHTGMQAVDQARLDRSKGVRHGEPTPRARKAAQEMERAEEWSNSGSTSSVDAGGSAGGESGALRSATIGL